MKPDRTYVGRRRPDGSTHVTEGTRTLPLRLDLRSHSPGGFEWGPGESGPAQLALALICDSCDDEARALACYQEFKRRVVQALPPDGWKLTSAQIEETVKRIEARASRDHLADLLGVVRKLECVKCGKRRTFWGHDEEAVDGRIAVADWKSRPEQGGQVAWRCPACTA
jgi:hypothetical protein